MHQPPQHLLFKGAYLQLVPTGAGKAAGTTVVQVVHKALCEAAVRYLGLCEDLAAKELLD